MTPKPPFTDEQMKLLLEVADYWERGKIISRFLIVTCIGLGALATFVVTIWHNVR